VKEARGGKGGEKKSRRDRMGCSRLLSMINNPLKIRE
jgi:hypothetical protein